MLVQTKKGSSHDGSVGPRASVGNVEMVASAFRLKRPTMFNDITKLTAFPHERTALVGFRPCTRLFLFDHVFWPARWI